MNKKIGLVGISVCCLSLNLAAQEVDKTPPPILVQVDEAKEEAITALTWMPGTVMSQTDSDVASEVDGRITWMANVGDSVAAGEVLAKIDDTRLQITLSQNQSNIARWRAQVTLFEKRLARYENLEASKNTSRGELETVVADLENARQELEQATLAKNLTEYHIRQSSVKAPFTALVVDRIQAPGEYTSIGQTLIRVVNPNNIEAQVKAPLSVLPFIESGMQVNVLSKTHGVMESVRAIVPVGNENSRMMEMRIALKPGDFPIGSAVRVAVPSSEEHGGVTIPRDALVLRKSGTYIYQLNQDNEAQQVKVETGVGMGSRIEVFGEVDPTQLVVIRGAERLKQGQKVRHEWEGDSLTARN